MGSYLEHIKKKSTTTATRKGGYGEHIAKQKVGFDTFEADLASASDLVNSIYGGWQSADTMNSARKTVSSMRDRLNAYKSYANTYNDGSDLAQFNSSMDQLIGAYDSALNDWDNIAGTYSNFVNAAAYEKAKKNYNLSKTYAGLDYAGVQSAIAQNPDDAEWLSQYGVNVGYSDLNDYNEEMSSLSKRLAASTGSEKKSLQSYYDKLETVRNQYELDNKFDLYKDIMQNEDFAENSVYVGGEKNFFEKLFVNNTSDLINAGIDTDKSYFEQTPTERNYKVNATILGKADVFYMTDEERSVYNYLYNTQGEKAAEDFYDDMKITLSKRKTELQVGKTNEATNSLGWFSNAAASAISVPWGLVGGVTSFVADVKSKQYGQELNPYDSFHTLSNVSDAIRDTTRENLENTFDDAEIFGTNIPAFLYDTALSIGESALGAGALGKGTSVVLGMGAASSTAKELKDAGASEDDILKASAIAGAAEMFFEKFSIDRLLKTKDADSIGKVIRNMFQQAGVEASEEMFTEITNQISDFAVRGGTSEYESMIENFVEMGYTEDEAKEKAVIEIAKQIGLSGIGGALSGGIMGGVSTNYEYSGYRGIGKEIIENNRTDTLSRYAEISDNQNIQKYLQLLNEGDATNAQIGSLYTKVAKEVVGKTNSSVDTSKRGTITSFLVSRGMDSATAQTTASAVYKQLFPQRSTEKLTMEERASLKSEDAKAAIKEIKGNADWFWHSGVSKKAQSNIKMREGLEKVFIPKPAKSESQVKIEERVAQMDIGPDTVDATTKKKIKIEGIRTDADGNIVLKTSDGEKSLNSVILTDSYAEIVAIAEGMEEDEADLFVSMYTPGIDSESYKASFDLAYSYGMNAYGTDSVLKNRGVLSPTQAAEAYKLGMMNRTSTQQSKIDEITKKHFADTKDIVAGKFDDSKVDYKKLNGRQKAAISFSKMLSEKTGVNLVFFESKSDENGHRKAENGRYERDSNTIYVDVYAGLNEGVVEDSIVPTLSHELTHWMKEKAPEAYANLSGIVMDTLSQHHKAAPEVLVAAEKKRHKDKGRDVSDEYAQDELIARACEDMLSGNKTAAEIIEKMDEETAKTFSEKFKEVVAKIRAWLKDLLKVYKSNSEEAKILRQYDSKLAELQKAWDEAFAKAVKSNQVLQNSGAEDTVVAESRRKYSDRNLFLTSDDITGYLKAGSRRNIKRIKRYEAGEKIIISNEEELRDFVSKSISGEITGKTVAYGIVSKKLAYAVYKESSGTVDVRGYYLELVADDINHSFKEHQKAKKVDNLPLSEEDFVTAILRVNSSKLVNVEYHADNSRAIKLCLEGADGNTMLIEVVSVSAGSIKLKTVWKETKRNSANTAGNRNSNPNSKLGSARDASVSKDSIPQNAGNIKKNVQFSDRDSDGNGLTKEQAEYFKNSKVRDENGNLKVMYHGTTNVSFTEFNAEYSDDGISLFFTDSKTVAKGYSGTMDEYIPGKKYTVKELTDIIHDSYYYVSEEDGKYHIIHNKYGDLIKEHQTDTLEEMQDYVLEEYGRTGAGNYKVYLNLENPYVVDANGRYWDDIPLSKTKGVDRYNYIYVTGSDGTYNVEWEDMLNQYGEAESAEMSLDDIRNKFGEYVAEGVAGGRKDFESVTVDSKTKELIPRNTRQYAYHAKMNGYDGVIIKDVVDTAVYAEGSEKYESSTVSIAFSSEQVKSVANENPTKNADIRYSDRKNESIYDAVGELKRIQRENDKLKADIERLRHKNRLERTVTGGRVLKKSHIEAVAAHILNKANSKYSKESLVAELKDIYTYLQREDVEWDVMMAKATDIAQRIVADARTRKVTNDYAKDILTELRKARVTFNDAQKSEAEYAFGKGWNRNYFGRVTIANDGTPLDVAWQEWANMYPDVFEAYIADVDMPTALLDVYDSVRATSELVEAYDNSESARAIAFEIYNQFWNVSPVRTLADKHEREVRRLKYEHRMEMKELREKKDAEVFETRFHYSKLIHKVREARDEKIAQIKKESHEYTKQYREKIERRNQISQITKKSLKLNTWLKKNSKDEHVSEILKKPVSAVLKSLNFSSERLLGMRGGEKVGEPTNKDISLSKAFEGLYDMVSSVNDAQIGEGEIDGLYGYLDMPADFVKFVRDTSREINDLLREVGDNEYILNQMSLEQLEKINSILTTLSHAVTQTNKALAAAHGKSIASLAQDTMISAERLGKHSKLVGKVTDFFNFDNALPVYAFKQFGEGGKRIFESMQDGWDKFAFNVKEIMDYSNSVYDAKEVQEWSKEVHEFDLLVGRSMEKVKMTTAQIMSLYALQKREQARGHLIAGGIRIADFEEGKGKVSQPDGATLRESDINRIVSTLTARQVEVADRLQEFMNTVCTDWGNEISMKRFGYKGFGEDNYFPIKSDQNNIPKDDAKEKENSLFRLLNMSFTKGTIKNANNRVVIDNIFDVFSDHTSDMAKYNALALPVLDAFKWYNYKEKSKVNPMDRDDKRFTTYGVKQSLEKAYGEGAKSYIVQFLRDINGAESGGITNGERFAKKMMSNYKVAAVGANLRVALLQPTSYVRASVVIDPKYLAKAFSNKPQIEKAKNTCGIALWKSLGFYDTNISKGVAEQIKHEDTLIDKVKEYSMKLAEWGDSITWGYLYNACEAEVSDMQPGLTGEAKNEAVSKRLRDVIYNTQVVDSTMTRTQMMRNTSTLNQMITAFMSEPMVSYNLLHDCYMQYNADKRVYGSKSVALKKNGKKIARATMTYVITSLCAAAVGAIPDTLRDDDKDEDFGELYFANVTDNMLSDVLGMIPLLKDVFSVIQGYGTTRMDEQFISSAWRAWQNVTKAIEKGELNYKTVYSAVKAMSQISGLPFSNLMRDAFAIWNNTVGEVYESLKVK